MPTSGVLRLTGLERLKPELAEAIATFSLVLAGCGAIVATAETGAPGALGVALTFAFVIAVMVYATGHLSGAHINPAITVAFAAIGAFPWRRVPSYIAAQMVGAIAAAGLLRTWFGTSADLGATGLASGVGSWMGVTMEVAATALLAFVIAGVATDARAQKPAAGLAIGLAVGVGALFAGAWTGGSMNPARSFGPALVAGVFSHQWVYLVGPLIGALGGMGLYRWVETAGVPTPGEETGPVAEAPDAVASEVASR